MRHFIFILQILILGIMGFQMGHAQLKVYSSYIEQYQSLAVSEMQRTGIPASIKMAQALIESNAGKSELATRANNHFGIKCGGDWNGPGYHKEDDDYDASGKLKKSCFRHFSDVEESYVAHSEFLRNPAKSNRYGFLFELPPTDYKSWAEGLKKAGYATNPNYARTLIKVIEDYKLYELDMAAGDIVVQTKASLIIDEPTPIQSNRETGHRYTQRVVMNNGVPMVFARVGDTPAKIADRTGASLTRILRYNERLTHAENKLTYGERIYLSRKKSHLRAKESEWHIVQEHENMYMIAQLYGIRLAKLMKRNHLKKGEEPRPGSRINIQRSIPISQKPALKGASYHHESHKANIPATKINADAQEAIRDSDDTPKATREHIVTAGDTLFNIAKRYGVSVESIRVLNGLKDDQIQLGQLLQIP
jgi:LysM repeat protein